MSIPLDQLDTLTESGDAYDERLRKHLSSSLCLLEVFPALSVHDKLLIRTLSIAEHRFVMMATDVWDEILRDRLRRHMQRDAFRGWHEHWGWIRSFIERRRLQQMRTMFSHFRRQLPSEPVPAQHPFIRRMFRTLVDRTNQSSSHRRVFAGWRGQVGQEDTMGSPPIEAVAPW